MRTVYNNARMTIDLIKKEVNIMPTKKNKLMIVSNDLGYGEVKASIDGEYINQPSVVAKVEDQAGNDPVDHNDENRVEQTVNSLLENLDATINMKRYLVGLLASNSTLARTTFDINSQNGKSSTDLSLILPLSLIAGKAVQEAYEKGENIFDPISVKVVMTTALPINEVGSAESTIREQYANRFTKGKHVVVLNNFDTPISVTIEFVAVRVFKEGEVATVIGIQHGPRELINSLVKYIKKNYPDRADDAEDLIKDSKNVLGIDIGQGTTDMAMTSNGKADLAASNSIQEGYGTVLRYAWKNLPKMRRHFPCKDVIEFTNVLNEPAKTKLDKEKQEIATEAVASSTGSLVESIKQNLNDALNENNRLEVIYVFGGGSIPLGEQTDLKEQLQSALESFMSSAVLVWVDKEYAQKLNEIGLQLLAEALAKKFE